MLALKFSITQILLQGDGQVECMRRETGRSSEWLSKVQSPLRYTATNLTPWHTECLAFSLPWTLTGSADLSRSRKSTSMVRSVKRVRASPTDTDLRLLQTIQGKGCVWHETEKRYFWMQKMKYWTLLYHQTDEPYRLSSNLPCQELWMSRSLQSWCLNHT